MTAPQIISINGVEFAIHASAQRRGHSEALADAASNLKRAAQTYRAQLAAMPPDASAEQWADAARALADAFETIGDQFQAEATVAHGEAAGHLTRVCALKVRASERIAALPWWRKLLARAGLGQRR